MKSKIVLVVLIISGFFSLKSIAQEINKEFKVSGELKGLAAPYMFIDYTNEKGDRVWDTLFVKKEKFNYKGFISKTKLVTIWPFLAEMKPLDYKDLKVYNQKMQRSAFFAKPNESIIYQGQVSKYNFNAMPTGTPLNSDFAEYNSSLKGIKIPNKGEKPSEAYKNAQIHFIKTHPKSEVSAYLLLDMIQSKTVTEQEAKQLFSALDVSIAKSPFYKDSGLRVKGMDSTKPGNIVPNIITKSTLDGNEFNLQSLRGKYVLIDFWGTWCGPCVAEMPKVKEYKEKYKDQLVILAIDSGDKKQKIIDFITEKGYDWQQLMSKKTGSEDDFVSKFNVSGFPTKFIVNPNGKILYKYVGNAEEAFVKLDELLKNELTRSIQN